MSEATLSQIYSTFIHAEKELDNQASGILFSKIPKKVKLPDLPLELEYSNMTSYQIAQGDTDYFGFWKNILPFFEELSTEFEGLSDFDEEFTLLKQETLNAYVDVFRNFGGKLHLFSNFFNQSKDIIKEAAETLYSNITTNKDLIDTKGETKYLKFIWFGIIAPYTNEKLVGFSKSQYFGEGSLDSKFQAALNATQSKRSQRFDMSLRKRAMYEEPSEIYTLINLLNGDESTYLTTYIAMFARFDLYGGPGLDKKIRFATQYYKTNYRDIDGFKEALTLWSEYYEFYNSNKDNCVDYDTFNYTYPVDFLDDLIDKKTDRVVKDFLQLAENKLKRLTDYSDIETEYDFSVVNDTFGDPNYFEKVYYSGGTSKCMMTLANITKGNVLHPSLLLENNPGVSTLPLKYFDISPSSLFKAYLENNPVDIS
ncbi:MAG: hypothetical protein GOU98_03395 [Candidatus Altiarchaeota archaeon]|nr:hypothetical protein [Candidatus Altiarchaeota archaeon]